MKVDFNRYNKGIRLILEKTATMNPTPGNLESLLDETLLDCQALFLEWDLLPKEIRNDDFRLAFVKELKKIFVIEQGVHIKVGKVFGKQEHKPWIKEELESGRLQFESYQRYRSRLDDLGFNKESLAAIDETTSNVLDYMGNPKVNHAFKSYGLLMGDVQSGKTATFTGICHKAVDAGYKFIIVLSGTKSSLRSQTQNRLNNDLVGTKTDSKGHKEQLFVQDKVVWNLLTTTEFDFTVSKLDSQIAPDNHNQVSLAVTQKNKKVLENILTWLERVKELGVSNLPLLLIDDEADAASINVAKKDSDPTTINNLIRQILDSFDRAAYLAVTATPFANVFIDPQIDPNTGEMRQDLLPDLFPRDYIYAIPTPKGYLGVDRLFGEVGEIEIEPLKYRAVIPISLNEDSDGNEEKVYSGKLKAKEKLEALPESLRKAVLYFLCVCTYKEIAELRTSNTSMLVHIARFKDVQNGLKGLIEDLVEHLQRLVDSEGKRITKDLLENDLYCELASLWNDGCGKERWYDDPTHGSRPATLKELSGFEWQDVWRNRFKQGLKGVKVIEANTNSKIKNFDAYYENKDAKLVVVGGDALSRGLTLEGLAVSYFSRRSFAYDTLLQMGRWFGYREAVSQYMKIWISDCLVDAYGYVAEAVSEFRETVESMRQQRRSPSEFGLRIRRAPKTVKLMVTAANKRRMAKHVRAMIDMTGTAFQASTMPKNEKDRLENVKTVSRFLQQLGPVDTSLLVGESQDLAWSDISGEQVSELLMKFTVPSWSNDLEIGPLAKRIAERNENWIVRVISRKPEEEKGKIFEDVFNLGEDKKVVCLGRTIIEKSNWVQQHKRSIMSKVDLARHWSPAKKAAVLKAEGLGDERQVEPWMVLKQPDEKPQLLIYPLRTFTEHTAEQRDKLEKEGAKLVVSDKPFVTLVFGIPGDGSRDKDRVFVDYDTNKIYQIQREGGYDEGDDE